MTAERMILPRAWVVTSALYRAVDSNLEPQQLVELVRRRNKFQPEPTLEKCVGEAVYERVRLRVLPDAPSRLRCLWAALDAGSALEFAERYLPPPVFDASTGIATNRGAIPVSTADGRWVAVDMHLFRILSAVTEDAGSNRMGLEELEAFAERYWRGEESNSPFVEVLADKLWEYTAFINDAGSPPPYSMWRVTGGR
jgi:hypothetical protein